MMYWLRRAQEEPTLPAPEPTPQPAPQRAPEPTPQPAFQPAPEPQFDEKEELPVILEREYCSSCITPEGDLKCPRRHRCKVCKCYLSDEEWFAQK